jgi:hypothetical protein
MNIKENTNPVGKIIPSDSIDQFIESMKYLWDSTQQKSQSWQLWKKVNFIKITNFLLNCLDDLIAYVDTLSFASGADKKATVLDAVSRIYDYIVREALPVWLVPFANVIRDYVIQVLISAAIDWIVQKYRDGHWRKKDKDQIESQWIKLHIKLFGVPLSIT